MPTKEGEKGQGENDLPQGEVNASGLRICPSELGCGKGFSDSDGDDVPDSIDNCPGRANPDQTGHTCTVTRDISSVFGARIMAKNSNDGFLKHLRRDTTTTPARWIPESTQARLDAENLELGILDEVKEIITASGRHIRLIIRENPVAIGDDKFRALVTELQPDGTLVEVPLLMVDEER